MSDDTFKTEDRITLTRLKDFMLGNGSIGAKDRLNNLEAIVNKDENAEGGCAVGKALKRHTDFHEKNKRFMWGIMVPVYITLITLILQALGVIK